MILKTNCKKCKKEILFKIDERSRNYRKLDRFLNQGKLCDLCLEREYQEYYNNVL